ncbi:GNAT family N-acetyltransferase [Shimia sp. SDUM112013]|uniref:GNAT family N-acetyltransferase n=1 Tax=Shimia sp. SDUM112013 TaxID=3136160 RepID=UPI0032EC4853
MENKSGEVIGYNLTLRVVEEADAEYIWGLRNDARYNAHLSQVTGTADDQRAWIRRYKEREAAGSEYYFVVFRNSDNMRCGTVRLYDIHDGQFTWGSWILDENKPEKAALDSAIQVYRYGFDVLDLPMSVFDVRKENTHTLRFHDRFGSNRVSEDEDNIYYELPREQFRQKQREFDELFK